MKTRIIYHFYCESQSHAFGYFHMTALHCCCTVVEVILFLVKRKTKNAPITLRSLEHFFIFTFQEQCDYVRSLSSTTERVEKLLMCSREQGRGSCLWDFFPFFFILSFVLKYLSNNQTHVIIIIVLISELLLEAIMKIAAVVDMPAGFISKTCSLSEHFSTMSWLKCTLNLLNIYLHKNNNFQWLLLSNPGS